MLLLRNTQKEHFELRGNQVTVTSICTQYNQGEVEISKHRDIKRPRQSSITKTHTASKNPSPTGEQCKGGVILQKSFQIYFFPFVLPVLKYNFHIHKYFQT